LSLYNWKLLKLLTEEHYTKSRLAQLVIAIGLIITFAGLLLLIQQTVYAEHGYVYDSYEEYNEIVEPLCKDHGGQIEYGSGECIFKNDNDRKKAASFENELEDRGLYDDYTAEEEASWNQNQEEAYEEESEEDDDD
jgi:hypothetical protein